MPPMAQIKVFKYPLVNFREDFYPTQLTNFLFSICVFVCFCIMQRPRNVAFIKNKNVFAYLAAYICLFKTKTYAVENMQS